jgi:RNA polymerase sigma-70 factor (ECF subfamily)
LRGVKEPVSFPRTEFDPAVLGIAQAAEEDKELALAFKRGEKGAYQAIYDRHAARVHGVCRRMLLSPEDAQEAAQETFLKVYQALNRFNGRYQMGAWITRIATNVCLDHLRSAARRPTAWAPFEEVDEKEFPRLGKFDEEPETFVIKKSEGRRVFKVLRSLPPLHRAAIVLRDFEGLPYCEIAVALGISETQVKALLHRARNGFKKSWSTTGLAALFPWNVVARMKRADAPLVEPTPDAAITVGHVVQLTGPISNAAASCSAVLQQCGGAITERLTTTAAAILVGTTVVMSSAVATPGEPHAAQRVTEASNTSANSEPQDGSRDGSKSLRDERPSIEVVPQPASSVPPAPEPEASPSDAPESTETADGEKDPEGAEKPAPKEGAVPAGLNTQFGFDRGGEIPRRTASSHSFSLDCTSGSLDQKVQSLISDGGFSYPSEMTLSVRGAWASLGMSVFKDGREFRYTSWGAEPVVTWSDDGLVITGDYGPAYGSPDPSESNLAQSGHFAANLALDCSSPAVITESIMFTAE